ncbi:hypothetical protein [Segetibacter koreensis]|uniref:hypothetical protein n=1 Tax=Segetibacter koreensis TaxID=398037 RepID=UPI0003708F97|nr:hypothetical protein [Segetibacter koreensis]
MRNSNMKNMDDLKDCLFKKNDKIDINHKIDSAEIRVIGVIIAVVGIILTISNL